MGKNVRKGYVILVITLKTKCTFYATCNKYIPLRNNMFDSIPVNAIAGQYAYFYETHDML